MEPMKRMKSSALHDALMAVWAMALALEWENAEELLLFPSDDGESWIAVMASGDDSEDSSGRGATPEAAMGALASKMCEQLTAKQQTVEDAMRLFDETCAWDDLELRVSRRPRGSR